LESQQQCCSLYAPHIVLQTLAWILEQQECLQSQLPRLVAFRQAAEELQDDNSSGACSQQAQPAAAAPPGDAARIQPQQVTNNNYCCNLLAATTQQQWQEVLEMTPHVSASMQLSCPLQDCVCRCRCR
jgi:hypothetical protein